MQDAYDDGDAIVTSTDLAAVHRDPDTGEFTGWYDG